MFEDMVFHPSVAEPGTPLADALAGLTAPEQVLDHPALNLAQKRAILAYWASDIHAVADAPALRQLDNGARVEVDAILSALKRLDGVEDTKGASVPVRFTKTHPRRRRPQRFHGWMTHSRADDDDDPPLPPAASAWPLAWDFAQEHRQAA